MPTCRACLSSSAIEYTDMVTWSVGEWNALEWFTALMRLERQDFVDDEKLTKDICRRCSQDLRSIHDFIQNSLHVHNMLSQDLLFAEAVTKEDEAQEDAPETECFVEEILEDDVDSMDVAGIETYILEAAVPQDTEAELIEGSVEESFSQDDMSPDGILQDDISQETPPLGDIVEQGEDIEEASEGSLRHSEETFGDTEPDGEAENCATKEISYYCERCHKDFEGFHDLRLHNHFVHSMPPTDLKCPYCLAPWPFNELPVHLREKHPGEYKKLHNEESSLGDWYYCNTCELQLSSQATIQEHDLLHTLNRPHACHECPASFADSLSLRNHESELHPRELQSDGDASTGNSHVGIALLTHCEVCHKQIMLKNMEKHMLTHQRKRAEKYVCVHCSEEFPTRKALSLHERAHQHEAATDLFTCNECGRKYASRQQLVNHRKQTHKERDFVCNICGNAFKLKNQLMNHMNLHLKRDLACAQCDKKFARSFDLNVHLLTHTGEKPYGCDICGERFTMKGRLTYHLQKHLGVKHPCKECGAQFNSRSKLKMHSFKHTGMPYRCEMCDNHGFANLYVFKRHLNRVHNTTMTEEALTEMFHRNTGKAIRIQQVDQRHCMAELDST